VERLLAIERTKVKTDGAFAPTLLGALGGIRAIPGFGLASCEVCVLCRWNSPSIFSARRTTWYSIIFCIFVLVVEVSISFTSSAKLDDPASLCF